MKRTQEMPSYVYWGLWSINSRVVAISWCAVLLLTTIALIPGLFTLKVGTFLASIAIFLWVASSTRWIDKHHNWSGVSLGEVLRNLLCLGMFCAILTPFFVLEFWSITFSGMYPSIKEGELVLATKHAYELPQDVQRGDIIVFEQDWKGTKSDFFWRVIGLPGDSIFIDHQSLILNTSALSHDLITENESLFVFSENSGSKQYQVCYLKAPPYEASRQYRISVPTGHFFVMGDNRDNAYDSRFTGSVPFQSIRAKILFK